MKEILEMLKKRIIQALTPKVWEDVNSEILKGTFFGEQVNESLIITQRDQFGNYRTRKIKKW